MNSKTKTFLAGISILIGTAIGAGVLGIPYVVAKSGFLIGAIHILLIGAIILLANLYLGEIMLRTKGKHQLGGYAKKYLGKTGSFFMSFAFIFGVYSAILAYLIGISESFSFLFFNNFNYAILIGILFGIFMSYLLWRGLKALKTFEKFGVSAIFILFILIAVFFTKKISFENLATINTNFLFLPFGVVLFALLSFFAIPEINIILKKDKILMKKILLTGTLITILFYILFTLVVVGFKGGETPEIATIALGPIFILLGIFTMFTSYLALGNALQDHFAYDLKYKKIKSWFLSSLIPIFIFLLIKISKYFTFTKILSIGGAISGGLVAILIFFMIKKAKEKKERKPEYSIFINWVVIILLSLIFVLGIVREVIVALR
ncbi:GerAB/ArcD/ProY family transporter [Candidatus Pacearchaeota archaeon]|nr:GerAB/ArcD/ProY family transporter [Candidatus Pacearchaeota archaeon]MBI2057114.1 GerAB/ArcD/ProY family transporter [Candidatus Pacearchaeota archaeon]